MPEITTPVKNIKVQLRDWITGRDEIDIQRPIIAMKFQISQLGVGKGEIDVGEASEKSKEVAIEKVVISVEGKTDDILNAVLDMHREDYLFVMTEIDKVISGNFTNPKSERANGGTKSEK